MRFPQAGNGRGILSSTLIACLSVASLLVPIQRAAAQGATSVETITRSDTDTIAVQLNVAGNPDILLDGRKASCSDANCGFICGESDVS